MRPFAMFTTAVLSANAAYAARPQVAVSVDPKVSRNGETVKVNYIVTYVGREVVTPPKLPVLADWELTQHFPHKNAVEIIQNGQITQRQTFDTTFYLKPLRAGRLRVPALDFFVDSTRYATPEIFVEVERLPGGVQSRPRSPVADAKRVNPLDPNNDLEAPAAEPPPSRPAVPPGFSNVLPSLPRAEGLTDTQRRETFFIRAEADKRSVYVGEQIQISYAMYERSPVVSDPEVSKFPDFKGFLKENLVVPKIFTRTPTELDGAAFLRSELIRYAVFPLKPGKLTIEPMSLRANFVMTAEERNARIMLGQPIDPREIMGIRTQKFTRPVEIEARPLPPAPEGSAFTGAVGRFTMSAAWPTGGLKVEQPFNVTLTLRGRGNLGAIQEPDLGLPDHVEAQPARGAYKFDESGEGGKTFEYILLPKRAGLLEIKELRWTYFDPSQERYVDIQLPGFALQVEGGAPGSAPTDPAAPAAPAFAELPAQAPKFVPVSAIGDRSLVAGPFAWGLQTLLYAALAFLFARRRQDDSTEALYRRAPWERTAKRLKELKQPSAKAVAVLADQWIRERLAGALGRPDLHGESSRDELMGALRERLHPEHHKSLDPLRRLLSDLDVVRFTGGQDSSDTSRAFDKAQSLVSTIVSALPPPPVPEDEEDEA